MKNKITIVAIVCIFICTGIDAQPKYTLYITIDDGPLDGSLFIDSAIRQEKLPVTLFLVGIHAYDNEDGLKNLALLKSNPYFDFCNHTYTHAIDDYAYYYHHPGLVLHDIKRNNDSLHFTNVVCRLPTQNIWRVPRKKNVVVQTLGNNAAQLLVQKGFTVIGWDVEWNYDAVNFPLQKPEEMLVEINKEFTEKSSYIPDHVVLLCHDWMFTTPKEKALFISFLELVKAQGDIRFDWIRNFPLLANTKKNQLPYQNIMKQHKKYQK